MFRMAVKVTSAGLIVNTKKHLKRVMRQAGQEVAVLARSKIRRKAGGGRLYSGHRASAPGEPPTLLSGKLARSIVVRVFKSGEGVAIRAREFYALFLEKGAKGGGAVRGGASYTVKSRVRKLQGAGPLRQTASSKRRSQRILEPRPFLDAALAEKAPSIGPRIRDAIVNGIEFKRMKAPRGRAK